MGALDLALLGLTCCLLASAGSATVTVTPTTLTNTPVNMRLPLNLRPTHYTLHLKPLLFIGKFQTDGHAEIEFKCVDPTNKITFHASDIKLDPKTIRVNSVNESQRLTILDTSYNEEAQMFTVQMKHDLEQGRLYRIKMNFTSILNDMLQGFYRSSYTDVTTGERRWLVSTQFSPTDARRAFPCWDEPSFKAVFKISILRPNNMTAISNMPVQETIPEKNMKDWSWDHFEETPIMSTYLVGFMVSDLASTSPEIIKGLSFKAWSRKDAINQTNYAVSLAPAILTFLESYFDIDFPLPKLDIVAVPDFGFSGMENWGMITFRESAMLYDPEITSTSGKDRVGEVIGHEIAHQWFGNLVTPKWWSDLWLKEGFATYIGALAQDHVEPGWNVMSKFLLVNLYTAFSFDGLNASHPILNLVKDPKTIRQIFDVISYQKGASVIRMMSHFLGEDAFQKGLEHFLKKNLYKNADSSQLWEAIQEAGVTSIDVSSVMDSWISQTGYPVVTAERVYGHNMVNFKQARFFLSGAKNDTTLWKVPISYTTKDSLDFSDTKPKVWLNEKSLTKSIGASPSSWFLANVNQTGYYRVNYDLQNWELLAKDYLRLPSIVQTQLLSDAFNLAFANHLPYSVVFNFTDQLASVKEHTVWSVFASEMNSLMTLTTNTKLSKMLKAYCRDLVAKGNWTFNKNALSSDHSKRLYQVTVTNFASSLDLPTLVGEAIGIFFQILSQEKVDIFTDFKYSIYSIAVRHGGAEEWDEVWKQYLDSNVGSDKELLLRVLASTKDIKALNRYLKMILDKKSGIRKQDGSIAFSAIAGQEPGSSLALSFMIQKWSQIQEYFGQAFNTVYKMVGSLSSALTSNAQLQRFNDLYEAKQADLGTTKLSFEITKEKGEIYVGWLSSKTAELTNILENKGY